MQNQRNLLINYKTILALLFSVALLGGCNDSGLIQISQLPPSGPTVIDLTQIGDSFLDAAYRFYILNPESGKLWEWDLRHPQTGEPLVSDTCIDSPLALWRSAAQQILFKCNDEKFAIGLDGSVQPLDDATFAEYLNQEVPADLAAQIADRLGGQWTGLAQSPEGGQLVISVYDDDTDQYTLFRAGADGTDLTPLTTAPPGAHVGPLRWSPDAGTIAFLYGTSSDANTVALMDAQSGEMTLLLPPAQLDVEGKSGIRDFDWSPDGQRILFASDQDVDCFEQSEAGVLRCPRLLYWVNVDGTGLEQVTDTVQWAIRLNKLFWIR